MLKGTEERKDTYLAGSASMQVRRCNVKIRELGEENRNSCFFPVTSGELGICKGTEKEGGGHGI